MRVVVVVVGGGVVGVVVVVVGVVGGRVGVVGCIEVWPFVVRGFGFLAVPDATGSVLRVSLRNARDIAVRSAMTVSIRL
jgi:hypothetical protein